MRMLTIVAIIALMIGFKVGLATLFGIACYLFLLMMLLAPVGHLMGDRLGTIWERMKSRRTEIDDLTGKVRQLDKAYHMRQLGDIYFRQGRYALASPWYSRAAEKDSDLLDARYKLGVCRIRQGAFQDAVELLEQVHATKPNHAYGAAYLHLAQAQEQSGNPGRAEEVYAKMIKFYPGHVEACYNYGRVLERTGDMGAARRQMEQVVLSVRNSPSHQRRKNQHWLWKAKWWLITKTRE